MPTAILTRMACQLLAPWPMEPALAGSTEAQLRTRAVAARWHLVLCALALLLAGPQQHLDAQNATPAGEEDQVIPLPQPRLDGSTSVEKALTARRSVREWADSPLTLEETAQLLWAAQGRSNPEGRRTAPSAGALYPLEVYLLAGQVAGLPPGVYRYDPAAHALAGAKTGDERMAMAKAALEQMWMRHAPAVLLIATVPERTRRKYGERSGRYIAMEVGHAAQNVYLQAGALGLGTVAVGAFDDGQVARVAGLRPGEEPLLLLPIGRKPE